MPTEHMLKEGQIVQDGYYATGTILEIGPEYDGEYRMVAIKWDNSRKVTYLPYREVEACLL